MLRFVKGTLCRLCMREAKQFAQAPKRIAWGRVAERAKVCNNGVGLSIQLHSTGIENPEELVDTSHLGHVMRLAFLLFFEDEKVDWVILRF